LQSAPTVFPLVQCGSETSDTLTLGVLATGFTPASLTFSCATASGTNLPDSVQYPAVQKDSYYSAVSQIRVKRSDWEQNVSCTVGHTTGSKTVHIGPTPVPVQRPTLNVLGSSPEDESKGSFSCFAIDFSPEKHEITWLKNGQEITNPISEIKTPAVSRETENGPVYSTASYLNVSELTEGDILTCLFEGSQINENKSVTYKMPQRPSVFLLPPVEQIRNNMVTLTCYVKDFKPKEIEVSWLVDDVAADSKMYAFNTTNLVENNGVYSVYGQLSFSLEQWNSSEAVYSCVVYHESLMDTSRVIMRSTVRRTAENSNTVNLNIDLPQTCKAYCWDHAMETDQDSMGSTALTFIILFLITLLYSIGTTAIKVVMLLKARASPDTDIM
uniref:Ig-like domain-containing protein n=1 Tax=Myripristis murdjan TaxID=586833 RepID=A0A667X418_9TELE